METLRIVFYVLAGINVIMSLIQLIMDDKNKSTSFNAAIGWACAIIWAIL